MRHAIAVLLVVLCVLPAALTGCGSSDSSSGASAGEIAQARQEAAAQQKIKDKQAQLEKELAALKKQKAKTKVVVVGSGVNHTQSQVDSSGDNGGNDQTFHAGSGNVSCRVSSSSASCTVASSGQVFVVGTSGSAYQTSGGQLPRGSGSYQPYGTSVSSGDFTCSVPPESQASGIACRNTSTGHGFEASRRAERQKTY